VDQATVTTLGLAARTYARHVVPLTLLSAIVFAPLLAYAGLADVPSAVRPATRMITIAWISVGTAWIAQFMLVGAAAPLARAIADGAPLSQLAGLRAAVRGLLRAVLPCLIVVGAIAMGSIALVIPGLMLGVLLSLTGASTRSGLAEPLLDSVERVRVDVRPVILAVGVLIAVDFAVITIPFLAMLGPLPAKPSSEELETARTVLRIVALGLPLIAPLLACVLAALATARPNAPARPASP
jgi:hypothetical protein